MKIALFTDLHYGTRNDSPVFYEYQKKTNTLFFDTLRNRGITDIICLGDLIQQLGTFVGPVSQIFTVNTYYLKEYYKYLDENKP